ncbi:MAG: hypothetical protein AAF958_02285 [Planctomycetota bacterium]
MMEIFVAPYLAVSAGIGYAVFGPLLPSDEFDSLKLSQLNTIDLIAIMFPISLFFALCNWLVPDDGVRASVVLSAFLSTVVYACCALALGLYLLPESISVAAHKRSIIIGIVAPFGLLLAIGWIGPLIWAISYSTIYLVPATVAIVIATSALRLMTLWAISR